MFEGKYQCECDYEDCHLTFDNDKDWETANDLCFELEESVLTLHPYCLHIKDYTVIEKTETYVLVKPNK